MLVKTYSGGGGTLYREDLLYFATAQVGSDALTLPESWGLGGVWLFLEGEAADAPALLGTALAQLQKARCTHLLLWPSNPALPGYLWHSHSLACVRVDDGYELAATACFGLGGYQLFLPEGAGVGCEEDGFLVLPKEKFPCAFRLGSYNATLCGTGVRVATDGSLRGYAIVGKDCEAPFEAMGVALRYATPGGKEDRRFGFAQAMRCVAACFKGVLDISFQLAPLAIYDPRRSFLCLPEGLVLGTGFLAWNGTALCLRTGNESRLAFAKGCRYLYGGADGGAATAPYLTLQGSYELLLPGEKKEGRLLCGTVGTEFLEYRAGGTLNFTAGPALLRGEQASEACTTAWAYFPLGSAYSSQPQDAPFYGDVGSSALAYQPAYMLAVGKDTPAVPLMAYGGASFTHPGGFEALVYKQRFARLANGLQGENKAVDTVAVTPQGLMAGLAAGAPTHWQWVGLANPTLEATALPDLRFVHPDAEFCASFQQADMCLLFCAPEDILDHADVPEEFALCMDGWRFALAPAQWRRGDGAVAGTALVLKYGTQASIEALLGRQPVLAAAIEAAYDELGQEREGYDAFLAAVRDPAFQGGIFLNCPVSVDRRDPSFLPELGVLLDSIDETSLCAHHVLLRKSAIGQENGLVMQPTQVDALIDHRGEPGFSIRREEDPVYYGFSTTALFVRVQKARVVDIRSTSEVLLCRFFASQASKLEGSAGDSLVVTGRLRQNDNLWEYHYALEEPGAFLLTGSALDIVWVDTLSLNVGGGGMQFLLGGTLGFLPVAGSDLFSYGREGAEQAPKEGVGLRFDGLSLVQAAGVWDMGYAAITLRPADSTPRANSFAALFPATPATLALHGQPPDALGYTSITAPLQQGKVEAPWYGLTWEVPLGGLGTLSPEGQLCLRLVLGWSPASTGTAPLYVGIKLWEAPLKLQGVFSLGFSGVSLNCDITAEEPVYSLVFNQFGIQVLGTTLPPGANRLTLFAGEGGKKLGWYAAYKGKEEWNEA